nr:four helix bundle protein [Wenzhouxiangella sp. AB-CW3]
MAWKVAVDLVESIYRLTMRFPEQERFGLTAQIRRAAVSVPSNIAEGAGRIGDREFVRFLGIARGSLSELETQLHIAKRLGYIDDYESVEGLVGRLFGLIGGLIKHTNKRIQE